MKKITEIYEEYKIMPSLQMHQLRVAAVALKICNSLDVEIDKDKLVKSCLLHDMGNVIKFDLNQTKAIFGLSDEDLEEVNKLKNEFINKYGEDVHKATSMIIKELGMSNEIDYLLRNNNFRNICDILENGSLERKVVKYSDLRVAPNGVVSYGDRMKEGEKRYKSKSDISDEERNKLISCGMGIEKQIFAHSSIKPEDITDESVREIIENLKKFEI